MNPTDFLGLGTLETGAKILNHLTGGKCESAVELLHEATSCHAYQHHRIEDMQDKISDLWDDHKDDVSDFFENIGESISDALESFGESVLDNIGSIFG